MLMTNMWLEAFDEGFRYLLRRPSDQIAKSYFGKPVRVICGREAQKDCTKAHRTLHKYNKTGRYHKKRLMKEKEGDTGAEIRKRKHSKEIH